MVLALAAHVALGEAMQLGIDERSEAVEGGLITVAPGNQQLSNFVGPKRVHRVNWAAALVGLRGISHIEVGFVCVRL